MDASRSSCFAARAGCHPDGSSDARDGRRRSYKMIAAPHPRSAFIVLRHDYQGDEYIHKALRRSTTSLSLKGMPKDELMEPSERSTRACGICRHRFEEPGPASPLPGAERTVNWTSLKLIVQGLSNPNRRDLCESRGHVKCTSTYSEPAPTCSERTNIRGGRATARHRGSVDSLDC